MFGSTISNVGGFIWSILDFVWLFLAATILHYIAANAYARWCTPSTLVGFLVSPFMTITPICSTLRWSIAIFGDYMTSIWIMVFAYISKNAVIYFVKEKTN